MKLEMGPLSVVVSPSRPDFGEINKTEQFRVPPPAKIRASQLEARVFLTLARPQTVKWAPTILEGTLQQPSITSHRVVPHARVRDAPYPERPK